MGQAGFRHSYAKQSCQQRCGSPPPPPKPFLSNRLPFLTSFFGNSFMLSAMDVDSVSGGGTGSACCRRERRLRQFLRHERLSVAMALSEMKHHTSRGQRKDRAGGEARVALHGHVPEAPLPQGRILRHVVGHLPRACS